MRSNSAEVNECQRPSITDVIDQYVTLRKVGRELWGLCPFHSEKTPSFAVNPDKQLFFCHGCHVGGDAITFIEKIEGVDFKTAARRFGLETYRPTSYMSGLEAERKPFGRLGVKKINTLIRHKAPAGKCPFRGLYSRIDA